jgi:hypothetical protein
MIGWKKFIMNMHLRMELNINTPMNFESVFSNVDEESDSSGSMMQYEVTKEE